METNSYSNPQDTVDAKAPEGGGFERFEEFESCSQRSRPGEAKGCQSEREGGGRRTSCEYESEDRNLSNSSNPSNPSNSSNSSNPLERDKLEERFRKECRKSCRRRLLVELFKTITKVAGVILAAMGLSSFNAED